MSFDRDYQRRPGRARSISFSIAYVRITEWVKDSRKFHRPRPDILQKALEHAEHLGDDYIVQKIQEAYAIWEDVDEMPTPKDSHPPTTLIAVEEARRLMIGLRSQTQPYSIMMTSEADQLDLDLDLLMWEMNI